MALRAGLTASSRRILSSYYKRPHLACQATCSLSSLVSNLSVSQSPSSNNVTITSTQQQQRLYTNTPITQKIHSINSDLAEDEIKKIIDAELQKMDEEKERKKYLDWKPGERKRPLVMSYRLEDFEEEASGVAKWTLRDKRCGALGIKLGMMPVWDKWGERHPCTVMYLDSNVVIQNKTSDTVDGYDAVQVGAGERKAKRVTKPLMGHYAKFGVDEHPPYIVREFRVTSKDAFLEPGTQINARHFIPGQNVDVSGTSKGKGFQGGMKRHGFKGMPASHGTSKSHRAIGSTGQCQDPGRVFKGKKMPGRMGGVRVTKQNLRIIKIDRGRNLIYLKGAVPGNKGEFVEIRDAVKRPLFGTEKCEGGKDSAFPPLPTFEYEEGVDGTGEAGHEVMMPMQEQDPLEIVESDAD
eukprot:CAMPEP_0201869062 /NCGR_PEP_ID=MMETSP0902-20130614/2718_1 /ASSEMBLY_ACC=CAM_ASM_000551 /TAXON_ID=420261 /ORGANISM="Thalassiosira antarctica, Strain CCMP982" /LENGTH=408 /DNA_ID=CAMNT_0048394503 /DNA_START=19 /DNA_END=1245 /DNA_ORIENTATION=+